MNFKKDVLKVIEMEVFSPTPQLPIHPCGMLCCVEMGFQEPRLSYSLWAVCLSIVSVVFPGGVFHSPWNSLWMPWLGVRMGVFLV